MKKRFAGILALMTAAAVFSGCSEKVNMENYVTLGDYSNLEVTMSTVGVDEGELRSQISDVYVNFATKEKGALWDRAVMVGDTANIDFVGKLDDVAFEGGTGADYNLRIGSNTFIPGFEEGLVGVKPGETVDLDISFPENYGVPELNGQAVVFTVTVNYIITSDPDEMDAELIASIGIPNVTNGRELEQYVYDYLYSQYEANLQDNILDLLLDRSTFQEFPKKLTASYEQKWQQNWANFWATNEMRFAAYGISQENYLKMGGYTSIDDFVQQSAEKDMRKESILHAIAVKEGMEVSEDELQAWIQEQADKMGYASTDEYKEKHDMDEVNWDCLREKVLRYLMDNTTVKQAE